MILNRWYGRSPSRFPTVKRSTQISIIAALLIVLVVVPAVYYLVYLPSLPPPPLKKTNLGTIIPFSIGFWEYAYADYAGFYEEEGLEVEPILTRSEVEQHQALVAGDLDFNINVGSSFGVGLRGAPVKIVLVTSRIVFALWTKSTITSIQDVKSVGMPPGGVGELMLREYCARFGLEVDKDVVIRRMDLGAVPPALFSGQVDGGMLSASIGLNATSMGYHPLISLAEEYPDYYMMGLVTTDKMIAEKPEVVKGMVKAIYRSQVFILTHREESIKYAVDVLKVNPEYAEYLYDWQYGGKYIGEVRLAEPGIPDMTYTMKMTARDMGLAEMPAEQFTDRSFLDETRRELGVSQTILGFWQAETLDMIADRFVPVGSSKAN